MKIDGGDIEAVATELRRISGVIAQSASLDISGCGSSKAIAAAEDASWALTERILRISGDLVAMADSATRAVETRSAADQAIANSL